MTYESEYFLVSLDDVKSYIGVTDTAEDDTIGYLMNLVSKLFDTATGRTLVASDLTEYYEGDGTNKLFLRSYPINSTNETIEVYVDADKVFAADTQIDSNSLFVDGEVGYVEFIGSQFDTWEGIKVVYNGGYTTIPYDLRMAALEAFGVLWKRRSEKRFDTSNVSKGDVNYSYIDDWPYTVHQVLERYRRAS